MMQLSLQNYEKTLPREIQKQALKNKVRECDETEKGQFVAYVDEGEETFDVSLTIASGKEIITHSCDCSNNGNFCRHKTALLMHIASGAKTKQSVKAKKKSRSEALLEEAEINDLKEWVRDILEKNKDIELSFTHYFSHKQQQYNPEEVIKLTNEAVKAVVKNKKNIDPAQLKKIVELWTDIHMPIIKSYRSDTPGEISFLNFYALLECCSLFQTNLNTSSNRITKYIENTLQQCAEDVNNLFDDEPWKTAVGHYIKHIHNGTDTIRMHYVQFLNNLISISNEARRNKLIDMLMANYHKQYSEKVYNGAVYTKSLFIITENYGLLNKYYKMFEPITFDNDFNLKVISAYIDNNEIKTAKSYCQKQIQSNYREEYNVPYLELLKKIYLLEKDEINLAKVLSQLFPKTFDFEDFLYISKRIQDDEEKKKWRTKILSRAKNASDNSNRTATEFIFKLMNYEGKYLKMIDYIDSQTPYQIILQYFEPMALTDKQRLLKAIIDKSEGLAWSLQNDAEKDKACFPQLFEAAIKHYTATYLKTAIEQAEKQRYYYHSNRFVSYMKQNLVSLPAIHS